MNPSVHHEKHAQHQQGMTLIEVLIAITIMAVIAAISYQSLTATIGSKEAVEDNIAKVARIDRAWLLLEQDLRNVINHITKSSADKSQIPSFIVEEGGDYWMTILRGGHANPLNFPRTELIRVGYRVQEDTLWRDVWYNLGSTDVDEARQQKVVENVEEVTVRVLPRSATSYSAGPWSDRWPALNAGQQASSELPLAIEVSLKLRDEAEIKRLFMLTKGE